MKNAVIVRTDFRNLAIRIVNHISSFGTAVFEEKLHLQHTIIVKLGIAASVRSCLRLVRIILAFTKEQVLRLDCQGRTCQ